MRRYHHQTLWRQSPNSPLPSLARCPLSSPSPLFASELLVIFWGVCFIATRRSSPGLKARNFTKSIQRGAEVVAKRKRTLRPASSIVESDEAQPDWESAFRRSTPEHRDSTAVPPVFGVSTGSVRGRGSEPVSQGIQTNRRLLAWRFIFVSESTFVLLCFEQPTTIIANSTPHALLSTVTTRTLTRQRATVHLTSWLQLTAHITRGIRYRHST